MPIKYHDSLNVAQQITNKIMDDMRVLVTAMDISVTNYYNGREVGHALTYFAHDKSKSLSAICYSENRNSDNIVVYLNSDYTNLPSISDEAYTHKKYFEPGDISGAAEYIIQKLLIDDKIFIEKEKETV